MQRPLQRQDALFAAGLVAFGVVLIAAAYVVGVALADRMGEVAATARGHGVSFGWAAAALATSAWLGGLVPAIVLWRRLEARIKAEERMHYLAHHDGMTGLPNRLLLNDRIARAFARARRSGDRFAVLCLDLDQFKEVNDTLGHDVGDELLRRVAARLGETVREVDTIGRLGGDEFAILLEDVRRPRDLLPLADRIAEALRAPHAIDGLPIVSSASIGIAIAPEDGQDPATLMKNADRALYRAKSKHRGGFVLSDASAALLAGPEPVAAPTEEAVLAARLRQVA